MSIGLLGFERAAFNRNTSLLFNHWRVGGRRTLPLGSLLLSDPPTLDDSYEFFRSQPVRGKLTNEVNLDLLIFLNLTNFRFDDSNFEIFETELNNLKECSELVLSGNPDNLFVGDIYLILTSVVLNLSFGKDGCVTTFFFSVTLKYLCNLDCYGSFDCSNPTSNILTPKHFIF